MVEDSIDDLKLLALQYDPTCRFFIIWQCTILQVQYHGSHATMILGNFLCIRSAKCLAIHVFTHSRILTLIHRTARKGISLAFFFPDLCLMVMSIS